MNSKRVKVRVPATSANIGGGFDCMGLALGLYHTVWAELCDALTIQSNANAPLDASNLIYKAMNEVFIRCGKANTPVRLVSNSDIPQASGLGSSASCIVAGVMCANALLGNPLNKSEVIDLCAVLDGHPDNILPAIVGGAAAGYMDGVHVEYIRADVKGVTIAVATPDFPLKTSEARKVLPDSYSRADCVYSMSRALVTFGALIKGECDMLRGVGDRLHQPYRIPLIKGYEKVEEGFKAAGALSCCVSGAGPSVLAFFKTPPKSVKLPEGWTVKILCADNIGATAE